MKTRVLIGCGVLLSCVALSAQSNSKPVNPPIAETPALTPAPVVSAADTRLAPPDPEAPTHYGMRFADFKEVNEAMMKTALEDPAIVEFSKKVEAMIAQREAMIIEAACLKYPAVAEKIRTMQRNLADMKQKKAEHDEKARVLGGDKSDKSKG